MFLPWSASTGGVRVPHSCCALRTKFFPDCISPVKPQPPWLSEGAWSSQTRAGASTGWKHQVSKQQLPGGTARTSLGPKYFHLSQNMLGAIFAKKWTIWEGEEGKYFLTKYQKYFLPFALFFYAQRQLSPHFYIFLPYRSCTLIKRLLWYLKTQQSSWNIYTVSWVHDMERVQLPFYIVLWSLKMYQFFFFFSVPKSHYSQNSWL